MPTSKGWKMKDQQFQNYQEPFVNFVPWHKRDQLIWVARVLFFLFLFLGAVILGFILFIENEVVDQNAARKVNSSVVFVKQPFEISLDVDTNGLPDCEQEALHSNVVMLLDQSGSMRGIPLERELQGALRVVEGIDLAKTEIAIVAFNQDAYLHSNWTSDQTQLVKTLKTGIQANGGTDISAALEKAEELFDLKGITSGQGNIILLFTDGGSDHAPAIKKAESLKSQGIKLFVVGLKGDSFDHDLLAKLVDLPSNLLVTDDPDEIVNLFGQVTTMMTTPTLQNLSITEPLNSKVFSLESALENDAAQLNFQQAEMLNGEPVNLSYQVQPQKIGLYDVSPVGGRINFIDCDNQSHVYELPKGPRILVIPKFIWLLLGYFFPLILFGAFGFWPREPEKIWRDPNYSPDYEEPPNPLTFLNGVGKVKDKSQDELIFSPTLIIGLGSTGFSALNSLKKHLLEAGEGKMPIGVRLLWIGGDSPEGQHQDKLYLDTNIEQHLIKPEFGRINIESSNPGISSRFSWWQSSDTEQHDRPHGRMTFFYDVLFSPAKSLKTRLDAITNQFMQEGKSSYRVFIISSPAENESSFMPDLVYWLRNNFHGKVNRILPWLLLKPVGDIEPENVAARRFAAMREIQRFMIAPNQLMETESGNYGVQDGFLFDGCMVFDQSSNPDATMQSLIDSICDQILLLIEDSVAQRFDQDMTDFMGAVGNRQENSLFVTSNSFTYYLPVEPIRRICEVRLLQDLFFATGDNRTAGFGILTDEQIQETPQIQYSDALDFLYWKYEGLDNMPFHLLAEVVQNGWQEGVVDHFPKNLADGYQWKLILYLNQLMNGNQKFSSYGKGLAFARTFKLLSQLDSFFDAAKEALYENTSVRGKEHAAAKLMKSLDDFKRINTQFSQSLVHWKNVFLESRTGDATVGINTVRRSFSSIRSESNKTVDGQIKNFKSELDHLFEKRIEELTHALGTTDTRSVVLDPQFLTDSEAEGQKIADFYYREYLLADTETEKHELAKLGRRVGWHWERDDDGNPTLKFVILPDYSIGDNLDARQMEQIKYSVSEYLKISQGLFSLVPAFSKSLRQKLNLTELLMHQEREVAESLERERGDRLLDYSLLNDPNYCHQRPYLLHPNQEQAQLWSRQVQAQKFEVMQVNNITRATGIWFVFKVPASILNLLNSDKASYYGLADLHVYPAEQYAVEKEAELGIQPGKDELLHPRLVRMMNHCGLFEAAMNSLLYGWLTIKDDDLGNKFYVIETENIPQFRLECTEVIHPESLEDALLNMTVSIPWKCLDDSHPLHMNNLNRTLDLLNMELKKAREKPYEDRQKQYEKVKQTIIEKKLRSTNYVERDIARLLTAMIKKESKY